MIAILLAEGFEDIEALTPLDLFRRVGADVRPIGITSRAPSGKCCGAQVACAMTGEELLASGERIDMLVLPGGLPGATNLDASPLTHRIIDKAESEGAFLTAICAAPFIYGKRGMLRGVRATAYPDFRKYLDGAIVPEGEKVVRDGRFITAAGMGAAFPFACELVAALYGDGRAAELARHEQYAPLRF